MTHVLIVEDHEENRNLLKLLLEINGYRVTVAGDGLEALAAARRDPPDAIVSDALMPKMDGFALCRAWMQDAALRRIPFIFYSATYVRPDDEQFGLALGAVRYLIKPLEAKVFLAELDAVLQQWAGRVAPVPAAPLDEATTHALHESALARKVGDKMAQLEAAMRKLQESETRFRSLTAMSSDFFWESDAEHRLISRDSANKKLSTISAFQRGAQIGERRWDIPYLSPDEGGWAAHRAVLDAHLPFRDFELSRLGSDGAERFISISGDPVFDASGAFTGYRGVGTDITERKRAESALRESEDRYRDLVENSRDLICTHDLEGKLLSVNPAAVRLTGYSREALLRVNMADLLTRGARDGFAAYLAEIRTKGTARGLMHIRTADGKTRWWEYDNTLRTEGVAAPMVRGMAHDVTERKRAESALRESEGSFRSLFERMLNGFAYCRMRYDDRDRPVDFVYLKVNDAFERLTGLKNVVGRNVSEVIPGIRELSPELFETYGRVASTGIPEAFEFDFKSMAKWLTISVYSPQTGYFVAIFDDITVRKRAEEELRARELRYQAVTTSATDAFVTSDAAGRIVGWNPSAERLFGYAETEAIGQPLTLLMPQRFQDRHLEGMQRVQSGGERHFIGKTVELAGRRKDAGEFPLELSLAEWSVAGGRFFTGIMRDISERKKFEEGLKLSRALIDQSNEAIEVVDPDTFRFLDVNQKGCLDLGYSREELLSLSVFDIDPVFDRPTAMEMVKSLRKSGSNIIESRHRRKDGSEFPVEVSLGYIQLDRDYVLSIARDITERKRAEDALRAAEEQFRGLVEQSIAGIYIIQDGKFAYVNPRFAEIFGYASIDELIGRESLSLVVEKDRGVVLDMRRRIEGGVQSMSYGFTAVRKGGALIEVGVHSARATHMGRPAVIGLLQDISEKKRAEEQIRRYVAQIENAFMNTVRVVTNLGEMRDPYRAGHERRVGELAAAIGAELGFDEQRILGLRVAGYLHDIGTIAAPAEILSKPGKLSSIEFKLIQGHSQAGYDVLKNVEFPWPVAEIALQHHERMDGSGYPQGLKGEAILLEARILAVADVVEAMASHRPYRAALGIEAALAEIERGRASAYDAEVADACLRLFRDRRYQLSA